MPGNRSWTWRSPRLQAQPFTGAVAGQAVVTGTEPQVLWQVLTDAYARLGFDVLGDEAFAAMILARCVEPASKRRQTRFHITRDLADQTVYLLETNDHLLVFDDQGTEIMKHRWPKPGTKYVSSGRPRGRRPKTI
jgi:hypothetical protein